MNVSRVKLFFPGHDKIVSPKDQFQLTFRLDFNEYI